jgi:thiol peroxidase
MNNTVVICISKDLAFSQKQFCSINNLDNLLFLSDMRNHDFANDYGILHMNGKFQGLLARSVVVINTDATIGYTQLVDQTGHEPNYDKVLDVLI